VGFQTGVDPVAIQEPGIGLWLVFSLIQFIFYNILIIFMESNPFTNLNLFAIFKKKSVENKDELENVFFSS